MNNTPTIHDDSHARAILLNLMRDGRKSYMDRYKTQVLSEAANVRFNFKRYRAICDIQQKLSGDSLITVLRIPSSRTRRELTLLVTFGGFQLFEETFDEIKTSKLYPVLLERIDSKAKSLSGKVELLCYISEHALVKMIRRTQCVSLSSLTSILRNSIEPFLRYLCIEEIEEDFVVISNNAYIPCTIDGRQSVIVKTYIPKSAWTPETEAKLTRACSELAPAAFFAVVPAEKFAQMPYWDSAALKPYMIDV